MASRPALELYDEAFDFESCFFKFAYIALLKLCMHQPLTLTRFCFIICGCPDYSHVKIWLNILV